MPAVRETAQKLSIMSFNIAHGRGLSIYQGFHSTNGIKKSREDFSANQTTLSRHCRLSGNRSIFPLESPHRPAEAHPGGKRLPHAEHGIHNTRFGRKPLCYGNAFLSKYPISECIVTPFGNRNLGEKGFMDARFIVGSRSIDIINLHLDFGSRRARIAQIETILERIKRFSESHAQEHAPHHLRRLQYLLAFQRRCPPIPYKGSPPRPLYLPSAKQADVPSPFPLKRIRFRPCSPSRLTFLGLRSSKARLRPFAHSNRCRTPGDTSRAQ